MLSKRICHRKSIFILRVTFDVPLHFPSLEIFLLDKAEVLPTVKITNCFKTVGCSTPSMVGTKNTATKICFTLPVLHSGL